MNELHKVMEARNIAAYIVPSSDDHGSEYVPAHFAARAFLSGFTGSAGTLVVLRRGAVLFTDGRYFVQAEQQLAGGEITLMRMGQPNVPSMEHYLAGALKAGDVVGADFRVLDAATWRRLTEALTAKGIVLRDTGDLVDPLWQGRPNLPIAEARPLGEEYAGETISEKLAWLRGELIAHNADAMLLGALDEIAWLYNLRGDDIPYNPLALCFAVVEREAAYLYMDERKYIMGTLPSMLRAVGIQCRPYDDIYAYARSAKGRVLIDKTHTNAALYTALLQNTPVVDVQSPVMRRKAVKNSIELSLMRSAHVRDGVAMIRFLRYVSEAVGRETISELTAGRRLSELRREAGAVDDSFAPIVAYGAHAAMAHYIATGATDAPLSPGGMLLVDSGGQYIGATTDVTRTFALGRVAEEQKRQYTMVLIGLLRMSAAQFPAGLHGDQLDVLARAQLWSAGLDYNHGTGHGIGSYLSVHEPPIRIHYTRRNAPPLVPGMVHSCEPGVYMVGSHGIRLENQLCVQKGKSPGFLSFETLTLVPFDCTLIDRSIIQPAEVEQLNAYHVCVRQILTPHLSGEDIAFLQMCTQPLRI